MIGGDAKSRTFPKFLELLIRARDRYRCAEPYCDAPISQTDHIERSADGGESEFWNGRGVCALHNYARELPGWRVKRRGENVQTTTPTGHTYTSTPERRWR